MDHEQRQIPNSFLKPSIPPISNSNSHQPSTHFDISALSFSSCSTQNFPDFTTSTTNPPSLVSYHQTNQDAEIGNHHTGEPTPANRTNQDPRLMLNNLTFLEQKIHQVQDIVRSIIEREGRHTLQPNELAAQQQLVTADLTSIIIQLISTAGTLLPSLQNTLLSTNPSSACQPETVNNLQQTETLQMETSNINGIVEMVEPIVLPIGEDHDVKDCDDHGDCENLLPGSYEVLQLEKEEILAPHTHFCLICGKGFKRDANLRMHMRGHGDEYKTPAALAKPGKESNSEAVIIKRYSCPFVGCKRNKEHKKFQPLKTIPCVKNHYKRSHCDKSYICSRCNSKKFSVIADLKTHEKHCGRDKWLCSCGTSFSRKDKLFGHVALFQGHTPALPMAMDETKVSEASSQMPSDEIMMTANNNNNVCDGFCNIDDIDFLDIKATARFPPSAMAAESEVLGLDMLPEDCISLILSSMTPRESTSLAILSRTVHSAMESDVLWTRFLPSDYTEILSRAVTPIDFSSLRDLYLRLCQPILIDQGRSSFQLERSTGKKLYMIAPRSMWITWGDDQEYWGWDSHPDSRFSEVAELRHVCWLEITGSMMDRSAFLSPNTAYVVYFVYRLHDEAHGLGAPFHDTTVSVGTFAQRSLVSFQPDIEDIVGVGFRRRDDGWLEVVMGEFFNGDDDGRGGEDEVRVKLMGRDRIRWKTGLVVHGIEFRPRMN